MQIASRCKWKFRYHFETAETLGFFAGTDGSNILRALRPLCAAGAIAVVDLPRKDGGHPILCFAILCNARDRADATVRDLYVDLYAEKALKPTRHHTDLTLDQVVTMTICSSSLDEMQVVTMTSPQVVTMTSIEQIRVGQKKRADANGANAPALSTTALKQPQQPKLCPERESPVLQLGCRPMRVKSPTAKTRAR